MFKASTSHFGNSGSKKKISPPNEFVTKTTFKILCTIIILSTLMLFNSINFTRKEKLLDLEPMANMCTVPEKLVYMTLLFKRIFCFPDQETELLLKKCTINQIII